jgi:hypothetical protein
MEKTGKDRPIEERKREYRTPDILASYSKEELEEINKPHGQSGGCACGCGCGCGSV